MLLWLIGFGLVSGFSNHEVWTLTCALQTGTWTSPSTTLVKMNGTGHMANKVEKKNVMKLCGPQAKIAEPFGKLSRYHNWLLLCMCQTEEQESGHLGNAKWYITEIDHWMWNLSERTTPSTESESTSPQSPLSPLMTTAWQMEDCNSTNWHCPWQNWIIAVSQSHSIMIQFAKCQDTSKGLHTAVLLEGSNLFVQACGSVSAAAIWLMHLYIEFQHANNLLEAAQGSLCSRVCGTIFHMQQFVGVVFRPSESSSHIFWAFRPLLFCSLLPNPVVDIPFPYRSTGTLSITITITITSTNFIGTSFRHGKPKWPMGTCLHHCKV